MNQNLISDYQKIIAKHIEVISLSTNGLEMVTCDKLHKGEITESEIRLIRMVLNDLMLKCQTAANCYDSLINELANAA